MNNPYRIVKSLLRTEKGTTFLPFNKYLFWVAKDANKCQIRKAIEEIYKVKVKEVNTLTVKGKKRRLRYKEGKTPNWKKAIVTLRAGDKIEMT